MQIPRNDTQRVEEAEEQARKSQERERLAGVWEPLGRLEVRTPVSGEVIGKQVFALREVARPGEAILRIVPQEEDLVVLARLESTHVDRVYLGQAAVLRFSAFPSRTTPWFQGYVKRVSADVVRDERGGLSCRRCRWTWTTPL